MRECVVVLKMADHLEPHKSLDYIGADRGALFLAAKRQRMTLAIGDFDSVSEEEKRLIERYSDEVISLNPIKDCSDSEAAIDEAVRRGYERIVVVGATGGRIDHELVNLKLCLKYPGRVILIDDHNRCRALGEGTHKIEKKGFRYVSLFAQRECEVSLRGFKYPLYHRCLNESNLYGLSNELLGEEGIITVHHGLLLCIEAGD